MTEEANYETALDILAVLESNGCECRSCGLVEALCRDLVKGYEEEVAWWVVQPEAAADALAEPGVVG